MASSTDQQSAIQGDSAFLLQCLTALEQAGANHFIQKKRDPVRALILATLLENSQKPLVQEIESTLLGQANLRFEFEFSSPESRTRALMSANKVLQAESSLSSRVRQIEPVITELTLNGLYSSVTAYREITGEEFGRSHEFKCILSLSFNDKGIVVTCTDSVGSLQRKRLLARLCELYGSESPVVAEERHPGQSGIGCKIILDNSADFFALSHRFRFTLVGSFLPLGLSGRSLENLPKNIHIIVKE